MLALLAEDSRGLNDSPTAIAETCEEILLSCGMADEACRGLWLRDHQSGFSHHILAQRVFSFIFHLVHKAVGSTDHLVDGGR